MVCGTFWLDRWMDNSLPFTLYSSPLWKRLNKNSFCLSWTSVYPGYLLGIPLLLDQRLKEDPCPKGRQRGETIEASVLKMVECNSTLSATASAENNRGAIQQPAECRMDEFQESLWLSEAPAHFCTVDRDLKLKSRVWSIAWGSLKHCGAPAERHAVFIYSVRQNMIHDFALPCWRKHGNAETSRCWLSFSSLAAC